MNNVNGEMAITTYKRNFTDFVGDRTEKTSLVPIFPIIPGMEKCVVILKDSPFVILVFAAWG
jgi:hypothetical protein